MNYYFRMLFSSLLIALTLLGCNGAEDKTITTNKESIDKTGARLEKIAAEFNAAERLKWEQRVDTSFTSGEPINYFVAKSYIRNNEDKDYVPQTRPSTTNPGRVVNNTKSVWVDKNAILAFANSLIKNDSLNGIRFYFAVYDDNASMHDPKLPAYSEGMRTLIFTATKIPDTSNYFHTTGKYSDGLYIFDYNSLCPNVCNNSDFK